MKIYVASSWRNCYQPVVVDMLRSEGHEVYDFRNPSETDKGFAWSDIDTNWEDWTTPAYLEALKHPIADKGFENDWNGMQWADACVLVMPCGRSAHTEAGWMQGAGKPTIVFIPEISEPELMYKVFEKVTNNIKEVIEHLSVLSLTDGIVE